jgi:hypothetical protein
MTEIQLRRHHNRDRLDPGYIYHPPFNTIKARRRMTRPKPQYHRWTDEEINLIAYCRARKWSYARIQRKHFPSFTRTSLIGTYSRLTLEERGYRASIVANSIAASRVTSRNKDSTLRREEDDRLPALIDRIKRYNLRPNRCQSFLDSQSRLSIDRSRFPQFFKSYKNHLKLDSVPDKDYVPPSHSPTPDPSDRSPSIVSSLLSAASSLELFGLEARSLSPSDRDPSVTSSPVNDGPSPEFLSLEDPPSTP